MNLPAAEDNGETGLPIDRTYMECGLQRYLQSDIYSAEVD